MEKEFDAFYTPADKAYEQHKERTNFDIGESDYYARLNFLDGYSSAGQSKWVRIETEGDLPKEKNRYLFKPYDASRYERVILYDPKTELDNGQDWLEYYSAWMPIPEYV